mmetsp:Transcript_14426/g.57482  ORF Transcript_14426/g.57482 Transcript_14426/m.57482 type:complete len:497 (-) Transcript_14426:122-1612(-)
MTSSEKSDVSGTTTVVGAPPSLADDARASRETNKSSSLPLAPAHAAAAASSTSSSSSSSLDDETDLRDAARRLLEGGCPAHLSVDAVVATLRSPLAFHDVAGTTRSAGASSYANAEEADAVAALAKMAILVATKDDEAHLAIGVITPYRAQIDLIAARVPPRVEVATVDAFQGRELDVVVVSAVRADGRLGFLDDPHRLNVAVSRARRACWVVGHAATLEQDAAWRAILDAAKLEGAFFAAASSKKNKPDDDDEDDDDDKRESSSSGKRGAGRPPPQKGASSSPDKHHDRRRRRRPLEETEVDLTSWSSAAPAALVRCRRPAAPPRAVVVRPEQLLFHHDAPPRPSATWRDRHRRLPARRSGYADDDARGLPPGVVSDHRGGVHGRRRVEQPPDHTEPSSFSRKRAWEGGRDDGARRDRPPSAARGALDPLLGALAPVHPDARRRYDDVATPPDHRGLAPPAAAWRGPPSIMSTGRGQQQQHRGVWRGVRGGGRGL